MNHPDLEEIYEMLAQKIDEVGTEKTDLFLAKLVLLLAQKNEDPAEVRACIDTAADALL